MKFEDLQKLTLEWADDMNLLHSENANMQFMKFIEKVFEFKSEFDLRNMFCDTKFAYKDMKLEMGDIFVALIILCEQIGIDPMECLYMAYDKMQGGLSRDE